MERGRVLTRLHVDRTGGDILGRERSSGQRGQRREASVPGAWRAAGRAHPCPPRQVTEGWLPLAAGQGDWVEKPVGPGLDAWPLLLPRLRAWPVLPPLMEIVFTPRTAPRRRPRLKGLLTFQFRPKGVN